MIDKASDSNLLKLIKFGPVTVMLCFAILMGVLVINENNTALERDIKALSSNYISQQRLLLKGKIDALSAQVSYEKNTATERLQHDIKERVLEAHDIAMGIYRSNRNLSNEEIGIRITDALRDVRFHHGRGYYFATTLDGISKLLPIQPELEGTSLVGMKDVKGTMIVEEMLGLMKEREETFYHWWFQKPDNVDAPFFKIGFIKRFTPLHWYIGTGEYLVDFETQLRKVLLNELKISRTSQSYGYYIVDEKQQYISHRDAKMLGQAATSSEFLNRDKHSLAPDGQFIDSSDNFTDENGLLKGSITYIRYNADWHWNLGGSINLTEMNQYFLNRKLKLEDENEETLFKLMWLGGVLTFLLTITSVIISQNTAKRFHRYESRIHKNMNKLKKNKAQLKFLANHDPLTKLPNRRALEASIENDILRCSKVKSKMAVMFFDLDDFKKINDHFGHATGDELLAVIGREFSKLLMPGDNVFRFGGDEFIFCFPHLNDITHAKERVMAIQTVFQEQIQVFNNSLHIQGSIGIAMYPTDASTASELIRKADLVLYKSKAQKKGSFLFYDQGLHSELERSLTIESHLRLAIENEEFSMVYQPQICANSQQMMGVEALIRWNNEALGFVPPDEFIGIAENVGLIDKIGEFVIEQSCADIANYNRDNLTPITLSINVSPAQLVKDNFVERICEVTRRCGLANAYVTIEITENVLISEINTSRSAIESLRQHGFDVSLDDFGTGYSSLSYLSQLPINEIKIDRSFIMEFLSSDQSLSLVRSIILIAESCHMSVVAEGVETQQQYEKLRELGCDIIQGYYFNKPLKISELLNQYVPERETLSENVEILEQDSPVTAINQ